MRTVPCDALKGNYFHSVNELTASIVGNQHYSQELLQTIQTAIFSMPFRPLTHHQLKWQMKCTLIYITDLNP